MPTDIELFDMLDPAPLAALSRERLEAELERIHRMLDRVTDYQRAPYWQRLPRARNPPLDGRHFVL